MYGSIAISVSVVACTWTAILQIELKSHLSWSVSTQSRKRMPNLNDFSLFLSKSAIELACACADLPPEKASRHAGYNQIDFANVRSRKRAWTPVIWSFPVKLLPSLEGLVAYQWWRHIRARYDQPPLQNLVCTPMGKTAIKWLLLLPVLVELRAALIVVSLCVLIWSKN